MGISRHEYQLREIEGFAENIRDSAPSITGIGPSRRMPGYIDSLPVPNYDIRWGFALLAQTGMYAIRALVLIYEKLDEIQQMIYVLNDAKQKKENPN